jgi:hypothetical protein
MGPSFFYLCGNYFKNKFVSHSKKGHEPCDFILSHPPQYPQAYPFLYEYYQLKDNRTW